MGIITSLTIMAIIRVLRSWHIPDIPGCHYVPGNHGNLMGVITSLPILGIRVMAFLEVLRLLAFLGAIRSSDHAILLFIPRCHRVWHSWPILNILHLMPYSCHIYSWCHDTFLEPCSIPEIMIMRIIGIPDNHTNHTNHKQPCHTPDSLLNPKQSCHIPGYSCMP
jgi:hypothetical protein